MQKTSNYNLNKPEAADPLRLADFNENADIIDGLLAEVRTLANTDKIIVGSYVGDGTSGRTVELGFTPKFIIVITQSSSGKGIATLAAENFGFYFNSSSEFCSSDSRVVPGGLYLSGTLNNNKTYPNNYVAFL